MLVTNNNKIWGKKKVIIDTKWKLNIQFHSLPHKNIDAAPGSRTPHLRVVTLEPYQLGYLIRGTMLRWKQNPGVGLWIETPTKYLQKANIPPQKFGALRGVGTRDLLVAVEQPYQLCCISSGTVIQWLSLNWLITQHSHCNPKCYWPGVPHNFTSVINSLL